MSGRQTGTEGCNWVKSAALRPPSHCHPRQEEDQQDHQQEHQLNRQQEHQQDHQHQQEDLEEDLEDGDDLACERQAPASTQQLYFQIITRTLCEQIYYTRPSS